VAHTLIIASAVHNIQFVRSAGFIYRRAFGSATNIPPEMPNYDSDDIDQLQSDSVGNQRWRASEPPPDPWGDVDGADDEGNWRFQIIGEEVDYEGNIKYVSL
jgi:hypothetical protein